MNEEQSKKELVSKEPNHTKQKDDKPFMETDPQWSLSGYPIKYRLVMSRFWRAMEENYKEKWTSKNGDEPNESWSEGLKGLALVSIAATIRQCKTLYPTVPPVLNAFLSTCKRNQPRHVGNEDKQRYQSPSQKAFHDLEASDIQRGTGCLCKPQCEITTNVNQMCKNSEGYIFYLDRKEYHEKAVVQQNTPC